MKRLYCYLSVIALIIPGFITFCLQNVSASYIGDENVGGLVLDSNNNTYFAGKTTSYGNGGYDCYICKYSSSGQLSWRTTFGNKYDNIPKAVAINGSYLYIIGSTIIDENDNWDILILKYEITTGNKVWDAHWGGDENEYGYGLVIYGDYLYISGFKYVSGRNDTDVLLLKFKNDNSGTGNWVRTFDNFDSEEQIHYNDFGTGCAYQSGYIYLCGFTDTDDEGYDLLLAAWEADDGAYRANFPFKYGGNEDEEGWGITTDANSIYVCGITHSWGSGGDAYLTKFSLSGSFQQQEYWGGSYYDAAFSINHDNTYLYTIGYTSNQQYKHDICIQKIEKDDLDLLWINPLKTWGESSIDETGYYCGLDTNSTYLYVLGSTHNYTIQSNVILLKFDTSNGLNQYGWPKWFGVSTYDTGLGMLICGNNPQKIYIVGQTDSFGTFMKKNLFIACFDMSGNLEWLKVHEGDYFENCGKAICTDGEYFYITGYQDCGYSSYRDLLVIKCNINGTLEAQHCVPDIGMSTGAEDTGNAITTDGTYCYVTGYTKPLGQDKEIFVAKFSNNDLTKICGDEIQWPIVGLSTPNEKDDEGNGIFYFGTGNITVVGDEIQTHEGKDSLDAMIVEIDPITGNQSNKYLWNNPTFSGDDILYSLTKVGQCYYATGSTNVGGTYGVDSLILKYDIITNLTAYDTSDMAGLDECMGIVYVAPYLYIAGYHQTDVNEFWPHLFLCTMTPQIGMHALITFNYNDYDNRFISIALDNNNDIYTTGYSKSTRYNPIADFDIMLAKFNQQGAPFQAQYTKFWG